MRGEAGNQSSSVRSEAPKVIAIIPRVSVSWCSWSSVCSRYSWCMSFWRFLGSSRRFATLRRMSDRRLGRLNLRAAAKAATELAQAVERVRGRHLERVELCSRSSSNTASG